MKWNPDIRVAMRAFPYFAVLHTATMLMRTFVSMTKRLDVAIEHIGQDLRREPS